MTSREKLLTRTLLSAVKGTNQKLVSNTIDGERWVGREADGKVPISPPKNAENVPY